VEAADRIRKRIDADHLARSALFSFKRKESFRASDVEHAHAGEVLGQSEVRKLFYFRIAPAPCEVTGKDLDLLKPIRLRLYLVFDERRCRHFQVIHCRLNACTDPGGRCARTKLFRLPALELFQFVPVWCGHLLISNHRLPIMTAAPVHYGALFLIKSADLSRTHANERLYDGGHTQRRPPNAQAQTFEPYFHRRDGRADCDRLDGFRSTAACGSHAGSTDSAKLSARNGGASQKPGTGKLV